MVKNSIGVWHVRTISEKQTSPRLRNSNRTSSHDVPLSGPTNCRIVVEYWVVCVVTSDLAMFRLFRQATRFVRLLKNKKGSEMNRSKLGDGSSATQLWVVYWNRNSGWGITNRRTGDSHYCVSRDLALAECQARNKA
jgi:hypothetical protein